MACEVMQSADGAAVIMQDGLTQVCFAKAKMARPKNTKRNGKISTIW